MADILNVGFDNRLLTSRRILLERAGHRVALAHDVRQVVDVCARKSLDVVVLCNSLTEAEKMRVADVVRRFCGDVMMLDLHSGSRPDLPYANAHLQASESHQQELLLAVEALTRKSKAM